MDEEMGSRGDYEMDQYFNGWHDAFIEVERALRAALRKKRPDR